MKNWICLIVFALISCENQHKPTEEFTIPQGEDNTAIFYEGRIPLNDSTNLYMELTMFPSGEMVEGTYKLEEFIEGVDADGQTSSFTGKYSTLYGETPEERLIQFLNSAVADGYKRTYLTPGFRGNITDSNLKMIRTELLRSTDLTAKISGKGKLIILDNQMNPVSLESEFNLVRRTSKLFTIEGYFRHNGDSADFLEMNTGEPWAVSKYGDYRKAIRQYHQLTKTKFEVTYLKGVGFSIHHINKDGRGIEALVIRRVMQMTTSPTGRF